MTFSILIPTWNNLPYLKCCIRSIRQHSSFPHEIILHVNEGIDGTREWVREEFLLHTESIENVGICIGVNRAFSLSSKKYIVYMNDDMYVLPGWDNALMKAIQVAESSNSLFLLSSTMIEPFQTGNNCVVVSDFGTDLESFREEGLLAHFEQLTRKDWSGSTWPPCVLSREAWHTVGGFSEEFSPGAYSDPDLSMKLWQAGCRLFWGVGDSLVYHFGSKSTGRGKLNNGRKTFLRKWQMHPSTFFRSYLRRGEDYCGELKEPKRTLRFYMKQAQARFL